MAATTRLLAGQERGGDVVTDHCTLGGGGRSNLVCIGSLSVLGVLHVCPLSSEEVKPAWIWQVLPTQPAGCSKVVREREQGVASGGGAVDGQAGDEVVDVAADRVDRDPADRRPCGPVCGCAENDVVGGAAGFEAVVLPDDVDGAVAADLGGGQWGGGARRVRRGRSGVEIRTEAFQGRGRRRRR